jgi:serine/threonine-protein kinase RIO1
VARLPELAHSATFFHGDLSTTNVLCTPEKTYLIACKIWMTGKL